MEDIRFGIQMVVDLARARTPPLMRILVAGPFPEAFALEAFAHHAPSIYA
jgi:hypothetical protein